MEANSEQLNQQGGANRSTPIVSAALNAAHAAGSMRFPGEDGGRSLAEMAQRDLDAALQLLADRAQYITGANGAAIALRRNGKNDMLCRASTGSNVPELGALLSTEFGLSGESVRTRRPLRCDDAERDARVNREVCREMGIASVVVMPVVNDDEVLGVFELFSGTANAFGDRDVSALQRLSEMVETAVRLAHASEAVSEKLAGSVVSKAPVDDPDEEILEYPGEAASVEVTAEALVVQETAPVPTPVPSNGMRAAETGQPVPVVSVVAPSVSVAPADIVPANLASASPAHSDPVTPRKPLFWSVAQAGVEADKPAEADRSHVPPMLRNLKKCLACGFPVSAERMLCVECEEKKWRGQLRKSVVAGQSVANQGMANQGVGRPAAPVATPTARGSAAAAAPAKVVPVPVSAAAPEKISSVAVATAIPDVAVKSVAGVVGSPTVADAGPRVSEVKSQEPQVAPEFILSAGIAPSQSWFSRNKFILGAIVLVAAAVVAVLLLR